MNLNIEIPDEVGVVMQQRAQVAGIDLATFVGRVVVENAMDLDPEPQSARNVEEFIRHQNAWVKLHPKLGHAVDDSRESIYTGRE